MHISDVDRVLQRDAIAKGMKIFTSKLPAIQLQWQFGGTYFASPDKLDPKVPFVQREVRQAMNLAVPLLPDFAVDASFNGVDPVTGRGIGFLPLRATPDAGIGNPFLGGGGPRNIQLGVRLTF